MHQGADFENFCQEGFTIPDVGRQEDMLTFESNVVFVMRYIVDAKIVGANWVTLPAGTHFLFYFILKMKSLFKNDLLQPSSTGTHSGENM